MNGEVGRKCSDVDPLDRCAVCGDLPEAGGNLHVAEPDLIRDAAVYFGRQADDAEVAERIRARARDLVAAR